MKVSSQEWLMLMVLHGGPKASKSTYSTRVYGGK